MANRQIFNGGSLELQILQAQKIGGSEKVFGKGKFTSYVRVVSGSREVGRSVVENANIVYVDRQTKWGGFDCNFKSMKIPPLLKPSAKLVIYDCDREKVDIPLGEAKLVLQDAIANEPVTLTLKIETKVGKKIVVVGTLLITAIFHPNHIPLYQFQQKISLNTSKSKDFYFGIGWEDEYSTPGFTDEAFSISFAVFNTEGNLIESIHQPSWKEKKSLQLFMKRSIPTIEDGYTSDKIQLSFSLSSVTLSPSLSSPILTGCLVLSILNDFQSLQVLRGLYCRVVERRSGLEIGRYCPTNFENPATSCMLMRLERDAERSSEERLEWCVRPHRLFDYTARSCGPLVPVLKSHLTNLFAPPLSDADIADGKVLSPALPPLPSTLQQRNSDRVGYVFTATPYTPLTPQTFCLEHFYDTSSNSGEPSGNVGEYSGEFSFGIRWNQKEGSSVTLDMDLGVVVLDNQFRIQDRVAGASPPQIVKRLVEETTTEIERGEDDEEDKVKEVTREVEIEEEEQVPPPVSLNGSLLHSGEISPERQEGVDDQTVQFKFKGIEEYTNSTYVAVYATSLTGRSFESSHLLGCTTHLFDSQSRQEIFQGEYENTTEQTNDGYFTSSKTKIGSGVLLAVFYKLEGKWYALSCNVPVRGSPPEKDMEGLRNVLESYLTEAKPLQLQMRINAHNTTVVKRYGHILT